MTYAQILHQLLTADSDEQKVKFVNDNKEKIADLVRQAAYPRNLVEIQRTAAMLDLNQVAGENPDDIRRRR